MAEFRRGSSRRSGTILLSAVRIAMNALDRFRSQLRDVFGDGPGRESGIMLLQQLDGSDPLPLGWALAANRLTLQRSHELAAPFVEDASVTQCNELDDKIANLHGEPKLSLDLFSCCIPRRGEPGCGRLCVPAHPIRSRDQHLVRTSRANRSGGSAMPCSPQAGPTSRMLRALAKQAQS
jgi:hypothetical protein